MTGCNPLSGIKDKELREMRIMQRSKKKKNSGMGVCKPTCNGGGKNEA
jgi:hypothetical protein